MKTALVIGLFLAILGLESSVWAGDSFNDVRARVYENPQTILPKYPGLSAGGLARAVLGAGGDLLKRIEGTLWDSDSFKERAPKLLHPMGVCAEAEWTIDQPSSVVNSATGLFTNGTHVKAIMRFSVAAANTVAAPGNKRAFALALKLFPTQDDDERVTTANMFFFDNNGLDGDTRPEFLIQGSSEKPLFFQNKVLGGGVIGSTIASIFNRFDYHPEIRPLYPLSEVTQENQPVANPLTPQLIHLIPNVSATGNHASADFRDEILSYQAGEIRFDIVLPEQGKIGTVTVGKPVISVTCDQELHFHHPLNRSSGKSEKRDLD